MTAKTMPTYVPDEKRPLPPEMWPNIDHIVIEDGAPMDNIYSEKQQRLLTEPLYASWPGPGEGRVFFACANVGLFYGLDEPPLVPDAMLSLDVAIPKEIHLKKNRSYFIWERGKAPEVVIEIVSNDEGQEDSRKLDMYAQIGIPFYVIWDPDEFLSKKPLRIYSLSDGEYRLRKQAWFRKVGLGVQVWHGVYEEMEADWLRWCDQDGVLVATGAERADKAEARAERLAAKLRSLGVTPENGGRKATRNK